MAWGCSGKENILMSFGTMGGAIFSSTLRVKGAGQDPVSVANTIHRGEPSLRLRLWSKFQFAHLTSKSHSFLNSQANSASNSLKTA